MISISEEGFKKLKVLGDKTRISIVVALLEAPKNVSELIEELKIEQSLVSQHLRILRECGLVEMNKQGKKRVYQVKKKLLIDKVGIDFGCCQIKF